MYSLGAALIISYAGMRNIRVLHRAGNWLFLIAAFATTLTCGFGGASIRAVEVIPGINLTMLKLHAWTAMATFLLAIAIAYHAYRSLREEKQDPNKIKRIFLVSGLFLLFFSLTTFLAFRIR